MASRVVNMTVPETLLNEADEVARSEGRTRSDLFREAVRRYVDERTETRKESRALLTRLARLAVNGPRLASSDMDEIIYRRPKKR